jgi:suppressor for copper-sensitivity B
MIIFIFIVKRAYFKIHFLVLISILLLGNIYFSYNTNFFEKKALIFSNDESWVEFNNIDLLNYISEGNIVFIDITADWCVTCKVNKLLVINSNEFRDLIKNNNVILMRGDWTKPNSEISNFLLKSLNSLLFITNNLFTLQVTHQSAVISINTILPSLI